MAIRKVENSEVYEKDVFAVNVNGVTSTTVISLTQFTIPQRQNQISGIDSQIASLNIQKANLQIDIDTANAL